ncbi:MAG: FKBP-type peptidyl-prolyl cis-trans isomerase [Armatimonadetes bacterium]|nr:MAG: FKBP-type peptidyl-prolyl cis-trans isomerase [Armatimonadota bacterium]
MTKKEALMLFVLVIIVIVGSYFILINFNTTTNEEVINLDEFKSVNSTSATDSATTTPSTSLAIEDLKIGEGREVKSGDQIVVHYLGTLQNGEKFDSSYDRGTPFETQIGVGRVIKGWDQGMIGMKEGGKRRLTIPSDLGYGSSGAGDKIPPDAILVFEVELLEVK